MDVQPFEVVYQNPKRIITSFMWQDPSTPAYCATAKRSQQLVNFLLCSPPQHSISTKHSPCLSSRSCGLARHHTLTSRRPRSRGRTGTCLRSHSPDLMSICLAPMVCEPKTIFQASTRKRQISLFVDGGCAVRGGSAGVPI